MKRYIDERRRQQTAQTRQSDTLRKSHQEQFDKLNHEMDHVSNSPLHLFCESKQAVDYYILRSSHLWHSLLMIKRA